MSDKTSKNSLVVLVGTLINVITGGVFFVLVPRILGPASYGIFAAAVATGLAVNSIANFGIDTGILRFAKDPEKTKAILSLAFKSYLLLGIVSAIFGVLLSGEIAQFLKTPEIANLIRVAFIFNILLLLTNYYVAALQARGEFIKASFVNWSSNFVRILLVLFCSYLIQLNLTSATVIFFLVPIVSVIFGQLFAPVALVSTSKNDFKDFYKYNLWIALSLVISSIPYDNYFLLKYAGPFYAGIYAAPFKILTVFYQFGGNLSRVFANSINDLKEDGAIVNFTKRTIPIILIFIIGLIALVIVRKPLTLFLFKEAYLGAEEVFLVLISGFAFFFLNILPSSLILYYFGKSEVSFIVTLAKYGILILSLALLVPSLKALGAAYAFTISEFTSLVLMSIYILYKFTTGYERN